MENSRTSHTTNDQEYQAPKKEQPMISQRDVVESQKALSNAAMGNVYFSPPAMV